MSSDQMLSLTSGSSWNKHIYIDRKDLWEPHILTIDPNRISKIRDKEACPYCLSRNSIDSSNCIKCGAPLGE
jgi:hypothetical protein